MTVGDVLRQMRDARRWRTSDLAEATGYCASYITRIEHGLRNPSVRCIRAIAGIASDEERLLLRQALALGDDLDPLALEVHRAVTENGWSPHTIHAFRGAVRTMIHATPSRKPPTA